MKNIIYILPLSLLTILSFVAAKTNVGIPINDDCSGAILLKPGDVTVGTTIEASNSGLINFSNCSDALNQADVWYRINTEDISNCILTISDWTGNYSFASELFIASSACNNLTPLSQNFNCNVNSHSYFVSSNCYNNNEIIYLKVGSLTDGGEFTVKLEEDTATCNIADEISNIGLEQTIYCEPTDTNFLQFNTICHNSCLKHACPDEEFSQCGFDVNPTIWFKLIVDANTSLISTTIHTEGTWNPVWNIYYYDGNSYLPCDTLCSSDVNNQGLFQVKAQYDTNGNLIQEYFLGLSGQGEIDNPNFEICAYTTVDGIICLGSFETNCQPDPSLNIWVANREFEGSLEGPFLMNEKIQVCVNFFYDASETGVDWLSGIIPSFSSGWNMDDFNFEENSPIGNGAKSEYYNFNGPCAPRIQENVPHLCTYYDENGILQLCNSLCEVCPCEPGMNEGDLLPSGWFWVSNGGNTDCENDCSPGEGWGIGVTTVYVEFCMDLQVGTFENKEICKENKYLQFSFQTFSDGVAGCWEDPVGECLVDLKQVGPIWEIACNSVLYGDIITDDNENCEYDENENSPNKNWVIVGTSSIDTAYAISDVNGYYGLAIDPSIYDLTVYPSFSNFSVCNNADLIGIDMSAESVLRQDIIANNLFSCPYPSVKMTTTFLRANIWNNIPLTICNNGGLTLDSINLELYYPNCDVYLSEFQSDTLFQSYNIQIDTTLEPGQCMNIVSNAFPKNTILGETLCLEAHINKENSCESELLQNSSFIEIDGICEGDSVSFTLTNIGGHNMDNSSGYSIFKNDQFLEYGNFKLNSDNSKTFKYYADGSIYTVLCEQDSVLFQNSVVSKSIYGCADFGQQADYSYQNPFSQNDLLESNDIDCVILRNSFDPNEKLTSPTGYSDKHIVNQNSQIEYIITFENIGNDVAYVVRVEDLISEDLDLATLQIVDASHDYSIRIEGRTLKFSFYGINLPPTSEDPQNSHGYVKIKISPRKNLPIESVVYNEAKIFFDLNEPIVTNQTYVQFGDHCLNRLFIPIPLDEKFEDQYVCSEDFPLNIISLEDPNGDNTIGWQGDNISVKDPNGYLAIQNVTNQYGCTYTQEIKIYEILPSEQDIKVILCEPSTLEFNINGTTKEIMVDQDLKDFNIVFDNASVDGCDSIINLTASIIQILEIDLSKETCSSNSVVLKVNNILNSLNIPTDAESILWYKNGTEIGAGYELNITETGNYDCYLSIKTDNNECLKLMGTVTVDQEDFYYLYPEIEGQEYFCFSENQNELNFSSTFINDNANNLYHWMVLSGVEEIVSQNNSHISILPDYQNNIELCLTVETDCGVSDEKCKIIILESYPQLEEKYFLATSDNLSFQLIENYEISNVSNYTVKLLKSPSFGQVALSASGSMTYSPFVFISDFVDTIKYQVCNEKCPNLCDESIAIISFDSQTVDTEEIFKDLSLEKLLKYEPCGITLFNTMGQEIYNGIDCNRFLHLLNSNELVSGVYFYQLVLREDKIFHGSFIKM
ncbi:MAG: hypothetical protein KDC16_02225 [Saprospiraceae bacterium]|nr:hypothetical protein [Saprospiraceae bacterium]MCB9329153.1 hypothetical protein [Lewinellaceae bacterium]